MAACPKTAIIIPCFNEEKRLRIQTLLDFSHNNQHLTFIFVDDGSTDRTKRILEQSIPSFSGKAIMVSLPRNMGKAEAVRAGMRHASEMNFFYIGYWDADLATPLRTINNFLEVLSMTGKHIVVGSRVRLLGRRIQRKMLRHYLGRIFASFASITLGIPIYDTQCGAKIFKNTEDLQLVLRQPFQVAWTFDVELLARFILLSKTGNHPSLEEMTIEYPLEEWHDVPGSKLSLFSFITAAFELSKIYWLLHAPGLHRRRRLLFFQKASRKQQNNNRRT